MTTFPTCPSAPAHDCGPVVILARHPLLGQGLAHWIDARAGAAAIVVDANTEVAVRRALITHPRLIIYERTAVVDSICLAQAAPRSVLLDITHAIGVGTPQPESGTWIDMILDLLTVLCSADTCPIDEPKPEPHCDEAFAEAARHWIC